MVCLRPHGWRGCPGFVSLMGVDLLPLRFALAGMVGLCVMLGWNELAGLLVVLSSDVLLVSDMV